MFVGNSKQTNKQESYLHKSIGKVFFSGRLKIIQKIKVRFKEKRLNKFHFFNFKILKIFYSIS